MSPKPICVPLADWLASRSNPHGWNAIKKPLQKRAETTVAELVPVETRPPPAHVGLWLDRCRPAEPLDTPGQPARTALYLAAINALRLGQEPADDPPAVTQYRPRFNWHRAEAGRIDPRFCRRTFTLEARTRILIGAQTNATVTQGAVELHHTYGIPYLPGAALKGICRHSLTRLHGPDSTLADTLFGAADDTSAQAGYFEFHDALWIPEAPEGSAGAPYSPLALDVVTPHHGDYYTNDGVPHPSDDPIPTYRLTITPGTRFLVVIEGSANQEDTLAPWLAFVIEALLLPALDQYGIGARTTAGFGRLHAVGPDAPRVTSANEDPAKDPQPYGRESPTVADSQTTENDPAADLPEQPAAQVSYNRGQQTLVARLTDGRTAELRGAPARQLLDTLPADLSARLERGKDTSLRVVLEPIGRRWRIVELSPA